MSVPTPALANLYQRLHIGTETELGKSKVFLYDEGLSQPCQLAYDMEIAKSPTTVPGFNIPHVMLATEDPHRKAHSIIEHKSGPHTAFDAPYIEALAKANQLLVTTLKSACAGGLPTARIVNINGSDCVRLSEILQAYNASLTCLGRNPAEQAVLNNFRLAVASEVGDRRWYVSVGGDIKMGRQINVEVPLRNIAYARSGGDLADQIQDRPHQEHFRLCRQLAIQRVDATFREHAFGLAKARDSSLMDASSVKLEKLKAVFVLYFHILSVELNTTARMQGFVGNRSVEKNAHEVLAKVSVNDLVRLALNDRDKTLLLWVVTDNRRWTAFKQDLDMDLLACVNHLRTAGAHSVLAPLTQLPPHITLGDRRWTVQELHDTVFKPAHDWPTGMLDSRMYAGETGTSYGTDVVLDGHKGLTGTGKPLGVGKYPVSAEPTPKTEPVIVFEFRRTDHPFSKLADITEVTDALVDQHKRLLTEITRIQSRERGPRKR